MDSTNLNNEYEQLNEIYDECLHYLENVIPNVDEKAAFINEEDAVYEVLNKEFDNYRHEVITDTILEEPDYETIKDDNRGVAIIEIPKEESDSEFIVKVNGEEGKTLSESHKPDYYISGTGDSSHESLGHEEEIEPLKPKVLNDIRNEMFKEQNVNFKIENEIGNAISMNSVTSLPELKSERLRRLSEQLPKIVITQSDTSLSLPRKEQEMKTKPMNLEKKQIPIYSSKPIHMRRGGYADYPKRLVSKAGLENVAMISNVPYERIRLLNDTFHTLINLRWRWIVMGTVVVHFAIWLVFAVFWYITALAHYDFEPNPPKRTCVTGGKDFVTIFLASVEAQTTIGFGDRAIDEECPESIFLFIMQLILGTGLSGVLTCVVYAKLTRPEKLSRDGVGFSKNAVISMRDGRLCLMMRAWDLNYDHIISSEFSAHFVNTHRTKEGETLRFFAQTLELQQQQFLLWPVTLVHVIDENSPLFGYTPDHIVNTNYEITLSLKGASASMGTFTQSQTSYLPREVMWGQRFVPVVKYDARKQKYVIDQQKLDVTETVDTPFRSASELQSAPQEASESTPCPGTPSSFTEKISAFHLERQSSFKRKGQK
ncbi:ATP-sensitive inward rectifier potassium channel 1-like isoform X2 [Plodia interpunctella]|uniref:ATP-sensitive inward rectifier potassium channel 1-like isoform X2 n=1 Tax=Plodia interpunctella TaxID=58824 RepID=UPI002368A542|nr:ATP-sensitive inward rectifier potassium channel 1-like isoform X2 [Plodia interpunctella]